MGTLSLSLCIGALNGLALALLLACTPRGGPAYRILALLIAAIAWRAGTYVLGYAGAYDAHRELTFFPFDLSFAYGPLLWLYLYRLTRARLPARWGWHFAPVAAQFAYQCVCFALPLASKWDWYTGGHLRLVAPLGAATALALTAVYLWHAIRLTRDYQAWLDGAYANRDEARLADLRHVLRAFAVALLVATAFAAASWFYRPLDYRARFPLMVVFALLTYALGFVGWRSTAVRYPMWAADEPGQPAEQPARGADASRAATESTPVGEVSASDGEAPVTGHETYTAGNDAAAARREEARRLRARVVASQWWRDGDLDLAGLAQRLGVSGRTLSRVLAEGLDTNFREFIGGIRIDAVATELETRGAEASILDIAFQAGFNSKASFNRAFKAHRGVTPRAFRAVAHALARERSRIPPTRTDGGG